MLWIQTFPQYAWPIIVILGLIILSSIFSCIRGCCCRRKNNQRAYTQPAYPQATQQAQFAGGRNGNRASGNSTHSQAGLNRPQSELATTPAYMSPTQPQIRQQLSNDQLKRLSDQRTPKVPPKIVNY